MDDPDDPEVSKRAGIALLSVGGLVAAGLVAAWVLLDRSGDPLYREQAVQEYSQPLQESLSTDQVRRPDPPKVEIKPLTPPALPTTKPSE
jgi:hypothetical protein